MTSFANMTANLNLNIQNFATQMNKASGMMNKFAAQYSGVLNSGNVGASTKAASAFKDPSRIVQGILVSKMFYGAYQNIRQATDAVWEFSKGLEYAGLVYSNLFHSTDLAAEFINVLKDFAAVTPYTFQQSEEAAKRLLAYGIQSQNVMYVMQGVLAAATVQNKPETIEVISRALGQIYTKGRLMNEEMRQLAEAGIPAYEILTEKLGLTQKQLQNLGRESIPASKAINALVDGINERFSGVLSQSSLTMQGIISNIKDNATMLISGVFQPVYYNTKKTLAAFGELLFTLRDAFELGGVGAVFETLIPPSLHEGMRLLAANLINLYLAFEPLRASVGHLAVALANGLAVALNAMLPVINLVVAVLSGFIYAVASNATMIRILTGVLIGAGVAWLFFRVQALATAAIAGLVGIINAISGALLFLSAVLVKNPITTLLILIGAGIIGIGVASDSAGGSLNKFLKSLTKIGGVDPDKLLLPSQKDRANDLSKFNNRLEDTSKGMDDLASSTGAAAKAAKGLLSFDEVFKLNENTSSGGTGLDAGGIDVGDLGLGGISEALMPEVPDFSEFSSDFVDELMTSLKDELIAVGVGTGIGGLIGFALFGPAGIKPGMLIGGTVGYFWDDLATALGVDKGKLAIGAAIMTAFTGGVATLGKYILGGEVLATIGANGKTVFSRIGGNLAGSLKFGIIGAIATFGAGMVADAITVWLSGEMELTEKDIANGQVGKQIGGIGGTILGLIVGGPLGAVIGGTLGTLAGTILGDLWTSLSDTMKGTIIGGAGGAGIGTIVGLLVGAIGGPLGMAIGAAAGAGLGALIGFIVEEWDKIKEFFSGVGTAVGDFFSALGEWILGFGTWIVEGIGSILTGIWDTIFAPIGESIKAWNNMLILGWTAFFNWVSGIITGVKKFFVDWWNCLSEGTQKILRGIAQFLANMLSMILGWNDGLILKVLQGIAQLWTKVWEALKDIGKKIADWWDGLWGDKSANVNVTSTGATTKNTTPSRGHAYGGVFNREHVARFAEGNKKEAIIPLENAPAMQPFVDAVTTGLVSVLAPIVASNNNNTNIDTRTPIYVGTLIADDKGLKELNRKMQLIQLQEGGRRG